MDSAQILMFGFAFILPILFSLLGVIGLLAKEKNPLTALWNFIAMGAWFFFALINVGFATSDLFVAYTWEYVGFGFLFMVLGFYSIFINLTLAPNKKEKMDEQEMRLE